MYHLKYQHRRFALITKILSSIDESATRPIGQLIVLQFSCTPCLSNVGLLISLAHIAFSNAELVFSSQVPQPLGSQAGTLSSLFIIINHHLFLQSLSRSGSINQSKSFKKVMADMMEPRGTDM